MEKTLNECISEHLKFEIEHSGKKKAEIAKLIGVSRATVSQYCSGKIQPTLATLSRLCSILDVSADDILCLGKE